MAIQIRRGTNAQWEALKSNIVVGELATTYDSERAFLGTGSGTYFEMANIELIADEFDSSASYAEGDVCIYQGKLYQFTADHSGAWSGTDVEQVTASEVGSGGTAISDLQDNALIHRTASGSIASFSDGSDMPMDSLIADINPVQNLNGYSHPWSGGGGNNKLPNALAGTYSNNGVTMVSNGDGSYTISGATTTSSANVYFDLADEYEIASGYYFYIWNSVANVNATFNLEKAGGGIINYYGIAPANRIVQIADTYVGQSVGRIRVYVAANTTISMTIKPMIAKSNSLTMFEPYENVCPISGWDSVDVNVVGKNLLVYPYNYASYTSNGVTFTANSDGSITVNGTATANAIYTIRSTMNLADSTYVLSGGKTAYKYIGFGYFASDSATSETRVNNNSASGIAFTSHQGRITYIQLVVSNGQTCNNETFYPMIRLASDTDATFEPYNGNTTTVDLGRTVYGGSLNVTTGVLTVDKIYYECQNLSGWQKSTNYPGGFFRARSSLPILVNTPFVCSHAKSVTNLSDYVKGTCYMDGSINIRIMDESATVADWTQYLQDQADNGTPVQIVCELATQTTAQLTPTQVNTLLGQNNVWADSGDVEVAYTANASLTIEEIINAITSLGGNV